MPIVFRLVTTAPMHNPPSSESIRASSLKRNINSKSKLARLLLLLKTLDSKTLDQARRRRSPPPIRHRGRSERGFCFFRAQFRCVFPNYQGRVLVRRAPDRAIEVEIAEIQRLCAKEPRPMREKVEERETDLVGGKRRGSETARFC